MKQKTKENMRRYKEKIIHSFYEHKVFLMFILSLIVGLLSGLSAVIFRYFIILNQFLFYLFPFYLGGFFIFLMPVIGGLLVGILTNHFNGEIKGSGVPEIMESMALKGGRIRKRVFFFNY